MFCPQCGAPQSDELKYCKLCGVNLQVVRHVVAEGADAAEKFDWSKTWVAEMFLSETERKRRSAEVERERGVSAEVKRYNEIKSGVITTFVGAGVAFFLFVFMNGIILSGQVPPDEAEILSRIWVAGLIPLLVGLALIFNGLFVSRKIVEAERRERERLAAAPAEPAPAAPHALRHGDTSEILRTDFSVTEGTTQHLHAPARRPETR